MAHCQETYPEECCGFFVWASASVEVVRSKNISDTKKTNFKINPEDYINASKLGKIIGIYHSHPDGNATISEADKVLSEEFCIPVYAFSFPVYSYGMYMPKSFKCELIGRPFVENIFDCLSLVRDYCKQKLNVDFPFVPYESNWEELGRSYFEDLYESFGFVKVKEPKPGDVVLFTFGGKYVCHAAILEDYNTLLHHSEKQLSCRQQFDYRLVKHVYGYFRHQSAL